MKYIEMVHQYLHHLSWFLPLSGGALSGTLSGTTISATYMTAKTFTGSGASLTNLNVSNATTGTNSISRGGMAQLHYQLIKY